MLSHSATRCRQTPQMDTGQPAEDLAEPVAIGRAAREVRGDDEEGGPLTAEVWFPRCGCAPLSGAYLLGEPPLARKYAARW